MSKKKKKELTDAEKQMLMNFIHNKEKLGMFKDPVQLQKKENLNKVPNTYGYYKWWTDETEFENLLAGFKSGVSFDEIKGNLELDENMYCVYVGISDSLRKRLKTHVGHDLYRSTLRRTLSCFSDEVIKAEEIINKGIDEFIGRFKVKYYELTTDDYEWLRKIFQKESERQILEQIEELLINEYLHILNIDKNKYEKAGKNTEKIVSALTRMRKKEGMENA